MYKIIVLQYNYYMKIAKDVACILSVWCNSVNLWIKSDERQMDKSNEFSEHRNWIEDEYSCEHRNRIGERTHNWWNQYISFQWKLISIKEGIQNWWNFVYCSSYNEEIDPDREHIMVKVINCISLNTWLESKTQQ